MTSPKTYAAICHVCGRQHAVAADFLFSPSVTVRDGSTYPNVACGTHSAADVRAAWQRRHGTP